MSGPTYSRRTVLSLAGAGALTAAAGPAFATTLTRETAAPRHALSVFGEPALPPDFTHFPYVNPNAPKGGSMRRLPSSWQTNQNPTTFNTFNMFIIRGDSPVFMELTNTQLMVRNWDEPDAVYGLLAREVEIDGRAYAFHLREKATFSDGSPITAEDVAFSFDTLAKDGHPIYRQVLAGVESTVADGPQTAIVTFKEGTSNRLPPLLAVLPIISKAYYTQNSILDANLTIPVTSGSYVVADFRPGRYVSYRRREDDWAADIPSRVGHNNFDEIRVDFFRERITGFEALKKGDVTYREEFVSKSWATEYNFPAVQDGRVIKRQFDDDRPAGAQGSFINTRRPKFADPRTREALGLAFDFEWMNRNLFYGLYERTVSFFMNSDLMATGMPSEAELALLEPFRGQIPDAAFGEAWLPAVTDGSGRDRAPLRRASELLREAGWQRTDGGLVNDAGERLDIEFLYFQPTSERILQPYSNRLRLLGINATLRLVESAQYQSRLNAFDFDITTRRFALPPTPGDVVREFWTSEAAKREASNNLAGIADPAVDALVETLIASPNRESLKTAAHALDRVLRVGHYWVPQWFNRFNNVAYWDRFGIPDKPRYELPVHTTWWAKEA
ncbi:MAG: extracellular solute-binding protein [Pseudomonadota bacterium]